MFSVFYIILNMALLVELRYTVYATFTVNDLTISSIKSNLKARADEDTAAAQLRSKFYDRRLLVVYCKAIIKCRGKQ